MNTPVIVPVMVEQSEPARCPTCGKQEKIKCVCAHCGQEYISESIPLTKGETFFFTIFAIIILWILITGFIWIFDWNDRTLVEMVVAQWDWIVSLAQRIY